MQIYNGIPVTAQTIQKLLDELEALRRENAALRGREQAVSDMSWQLNPDRMGGQFTEQEVYDSLDPRY